MGGEVDDCYVVLDGGCGHFSNLLLILGIYVSFRGFSDFLRRPEIIGITRCRLFRINDDLSS